jgi:hypothetical protein
VPTARALLGRSALVVSTAGTNRRTRDAELRKTWYACCGFAVFAAVLRYATANGWSIAIGDHVKDDRWFVTKLGKHTNHGTIITVDDMALEVHVDEKTTMRRRNVTAAERASRRYPFFLRDEVVEYTATGKLSFYIHGIEATGV